ncbi:MAG: carbohydrate kinase [Bacillus sp. (in: Bacteria)]|nr:carbohydrate kinase [Bacillus sp. (in: firmicutes)]
MTYIATFDIGTTAIKGLLITSDFAIRGEITFPLDTIHGTNGAMEQAPEDWWQGVRLISAHWWENEGIRAEEIKMISFSGQMEDVIPIPYSGDQPNAILYSDTRAKVEAEMLQGLFPNIRSLIGNTIGPSTPMAKIIWLRQNDVELFSKTKCFLFSSKDYIVYKLTGKFVSDPVTCATTGMMNIKTKTWLGEILNEGEIPFEMLPSINYPDQVVGSVGQQAAVETGFTEGTPVLCGSGDAGASTMGAGAVKDGDSYLYLGTTGWVAASTKEPEFNNKGIFNLAHLPSEQYIFIAPLLNVGNVHQWACQTFVNTKDGDDPYAGFEESVSKSQAGSNGLLFLPYLHGERCYIQDEDAKGAFWGINPKTNMNDFARAVVEGLCYSLKQTLEMLLKDKDGKVTLIGGGTKSSVWCQCLADILGKTIKIPFDSEYLPAIGAASSAFIQLGWADSYECFANSHLKRIKTKEYHPNPENIVLYQGLYEKFTRLYPNLKIIYMG